MAIGEDWKNKEYSFFSHTKCEYFPCHSGVSRDSFNCLFCYCPLYAYGDKCGGAFTYTKNGIKDCGNCTIPHCKDNYRYIIDKFKDLSRGKPVDSFGD